MTENVQDSSAQDPKQDIKVSDKEINFRNLQAKYERQLEQERAARLEAEKKVQEMNSKSQSTSDDDEDDDSEPYVDKRKLAKKLNSFGQRTQSEIQKSSEMTKNQVKEELRQEMWIENNPDFFDILQHADKLAQRSPKLAEALLKMPDNFDRQRLVYQNIKEFGLHQAEAPKKTMQETIDNNKRGQFYRPTGIANSPHEFGGDFSAAGKKNAYNKIQELKARIGAR